MLGNFHLKLKFEVKLRVSLFPDCKSYSQESGTGSLKYRFSRLLKSTKLIIT